MTGRGAGFCSGYDAPGYMNPGPARGFGTGWGGGWGRRGGGRGWRHWFHATGLPRWARFGGGYGAPTPEQEAEGLKAQAEGLQQQLDAIQQRIQELEQGE
jgi:hypothetical protein